MSDPQRPPDIHVVSSRLSARRSQVIESVRSPIGFFTLSLLIVEAFLLGAAFLLPPAMRVAAFFIGIALFLLVFGAVFWLVVKHPRNLIFGERSQLEWEAMQMYGQSSRPLSSEELYALPVVPASASDMQQLPAAESEPAE